jgi:hypothetical protein
MSCLTKDILSTTRESGVFLLRFPYGRELLRFHILLDH